MKTWIRFDSHGDRFAHLLCGHCRHSIYHGQPYLKLQSPEWKTPKLRCVQCAGEPPQFEREAPVDKHGRVEQAVADAMQRLTGSVQQTFDMEAD